MKTIQSKSFFLSIVLIAGLLFGISACNQKTNVSEQGTEGTYEFKGKIAKSYEESVEDWPEYVTAPEGAPNILLIMLDDVGYGQIGCYGGLTETPNIDKLADNGLRYTNFHTLALCSPSRASIMAGRNHHSIGLGSHSLTAMGFPGYNAFPGEDVKSIAKHLQQQGYVNYAIGKWDHTPLYEVSESGPFDRWPSGEGFDHFYGFMAADADNFRSLIWSDHTPIEDWEDKPGYHYSEAMANKAIHHFTSHVSVSPDKPWMMYWAPVAMHSPHQAPQEYITKYKGKFDDGWDKARETIFAKQKEIGIMPKDAILSQRTDEIPAWESLDPKEQKLFARQMEAFAGMLDHVDDQIGRMVATLERTKQLENTIIIVTSDNGASGEGGLTGSFNETYVLNGLQTPFDANMKHYDGWGGQETYPHYHAGWALAGNTPFKYFKQIVHRGGVADPFIVHWPKGIIAKGELRKQFHHIIDVAATILEVTGVKFLENLDGHKQKPLDGVSMAYSLNDAEAPDRHTQQYFEMWGNRAMYKDGWKAVTIHANSMPWEPVIAPFEEDVWELYNIKEDPTETNNLADNNPEKLEELIKLWEEEAWKYNVYPLYDDLMMRNVRQQDRLFGDRKEFVYYAPGAVRIAEKASVPVKGRSHSIEVDLELSGKEEGVLLACGGFTGGYTLFIKDNKVYYDYNYYNGLYYTLESPPIGTGQVNIKFNFIEDPKANIPKLPSGIGELWINGEKVDEVVMPEMHITTFSLSETFDVGVDYGTPVSDKYRIVNHYPFTGELDKVMVRLTD